MPAPAFRLLKSKWRKFFYLDSKKTLDFFNEWCYNKNNEMNRSELK